MNKKFNLLLVVLSFCFFSYESIATEKQSIPKWSGNIYKIISQYNKVYGQFSRKVCKPGEEGKYYKLLKAYRGQGFYLPKVGDDIDRNAIKSNLHHFSKKIKFIRGLSKKLKKQKGFPEFKHMKVELQAIIDELLLMKKRYHQAIRTEKKKEILSHSQKELSRLKRQFKVFMNQIFFLKSYNFPNDYLTNRRDFEKYKGLEGLNNKKKANKIFFYRRITEDGAYDPNHTRPDKFTRTTLDTLFLNIQKEKDFISENVRYDLEWVFKRLEYILKRGKKVQLLRLAEWEERTKQSQKFYSDIIKTKNNNKATFLVKKENEASSNLKNYVYRKQGEVYNFWADKSELFKALFALETILVHEVGVIDGEFGLERASVARVVINRFYDNFYSQLANWQGIHSHIKKDINKEKELWLNVLFRVGEFSFTYHYIPAVSKIFCPDMSRRGKGIRNKNLKISLKALKHYDGSFKAFRYFSRISMMGKIDMSTVWTSYARLPEMPGYKSSHQRKLSRYFHADNYKYLYSFADKRNVEFTVVKINKKTYSMRWEKGRPVFYDYRNPHLFTYFSKQY